MKEIYKISTTNVSVFSPFLLLIQTTAGMTLVNYKEARQVPPRPTPTSLLTKPPLVCSPSEPWTPVGSPTSCILSCRVVVVNDKFGLLFALT